MATASSLAPPLLRLLRGLDGVPHNGGCVGPPQPAAERATLAAGSPGWQRPFLSKPTTANVALQQRGRLLRVLHATEM